MRLNYESPPVYVEPYAGGASLALSLLFGGLVSRVFLNDLDPAIYAFWRSVLDQPTQFISLIQRTPVSTAEWRRQKQTYQVRDLSKPLQLGFATFYLNRTSHSGILNGGVIGGRKQQGTWKIDARFNKPELVRRIERLVSFRDRIHVSGLDALSVLAIHRRRVRPLVYLDPPYFGAGRDLYMNAYRPGDHASVRDAVIALNVPWVVSYDDVPEIRTLYSGCRSRRIVLRHNARVSKEGREVVFFSERLRIPNASQ